MSLVPTFTMSPMVPNTARCVPGGTLIPGIAGSSTEPHSMAVEYYQEWPLNCWRFSSKRELETQKELGNGGMGWKQTLLANTRHHHKMVEQGCPREQGPQGYAALGWG